MSNDSIISRPEDVGLCSKRLARIDAWRDKLVADGKLAGLTTVVARRGQVAHWGMSGSADKERGTPIAADTIFRIFSMTKPITAMAILMLYEEGRFQLDDPISQFLPAFANLRVAQFDANGITDMVRAEREITFRHLLTHTSGLTYGGLNQMPVDAMYRDAGIGAFMDHPEADLMETTQKLAGLPLLAQPGTEWNYSAANDVLGALVQTISGQRFGAFLQERILGPLGMRDTDFGVPVEKIGRLAAFYARDPKGGVMPGSDPGKYHIAGNRRMESGGGGLVSTMGDYLTFCHMLLNKGVHEGMHLLGRKTVELMTSNHLPGDMADMGQPQFGGFTYFGIGFGLGVAVMLDPAKAQVLGTPGEYAWSGVASTAFWVDPVEEMIVILMTQMFPIAAYPLRRELRVLSYQSVID